MQHTEQDTEHRIQNTQRTTQHTETETNNPAQNSTQPQRTENSAHNYRTYSYDLYHEYVAIRNSDTIELYTILQD